MYSLRACASRLLPRATHVAPSSWMMSGSASMPRKDQQARVAKPASACQATVAVRGFSAEAASGDRGGVSLVLHDDGFADVIMSRPTQFNTFNDALIKRFTEVFEALRDHNGLRAVFVKSTGKVFSAGADLTWMKRTATYTREQNLADAMELGRMLNTLASLPVPTIALINGLAFGGGVGLVSCCDISVAIAKARFTLSEVKLGLLPATISPYVIRKMGANNCRRYFLTAEQFDAAQAREMGLLQEVVEDSEGLAAMEQRFKDAIRLTSPAAVAASIALIDAVADKPITDELIADTAARLCDQRASPEGVEGLTAFLEKRKPWWAEEE